MHTVTYTPHKPAETTAEFKSGTAAYRFARQMKDYNLQLSVIITDDDGGTMVLQQNGWSRA